MDWMIAYYSAAVLLWVFLAVMAVGTLRPGFTAWLQAHPRVRLNLLGTNQLPKNPERVLRRFYLFLAGGWTWILVWAWWLMPAIRAWFFKRVTTGKGYETAKIATLIVLAAYAVTGFYAIGKAVSIWFREIYAPESASGWRQ